MRIFLAGATGAIGRRLVPALVRAGHQVTGTTRHSGRTDRVLAAGAEPVVLEPFDRAAVIAAVAAAKPDIVINQLTALAGVTDFKRLDREFATTNRLRTEALDHLLDAAVAAGARRFIAQSYTGFTNVRAGGPVKTEDDPLDPDPTTASRETLSAIRHLETRVSGAEDIAGLALRYGNLYGPGTGMEIGGPLVRTVEKRQFPVVGGGTGVWSFIHVDDAVAATVAALERGSPGVYNITDDEPAPVADWLPYLAEAVGAKPPRRLPAWLARPMLGEHGLSLMTAIRGAANAKAKRELGWTPAYPSWRQGFRTGLG